MEFLIILGLCFAFVYVLKNATIGQIIFAAILFGLMGLAIGGSAVNQSGYERSMNSAIRTVSPQRAEGYIRGNEQFRRCVERVQAQGKTGIAAWVEC